MSGSFFRLIITLHIPYLDFFQAQLKINWRFTNPIDGEVYNVLFSNLKNNIDARRKTQ